MALLLAFRIGWSRGSAKKRRFLSLRPFDLHVHKSQRWCLQSLLLLTLFSEYVSSRPKSTTSLLLLLWTHLKSYLPPADDNSSIVCRQEDYNWIVGSRIAVREWSRRIISSLSRARSELLSKLVIKTTYHLQLHSGNCQRFKRSTVNTQKE